jgi:hypothetical protein
MAKVDWSDSEIAQAHSTKVHHGCWMRESNVITYAKRTTMTLPAILKNAGARFIGFFACHTPNLVVSDVA